MNSHELPSLPALAAFARYAQVTTVANLKLVRFSEEVDPRDSSPETQEQLIDAIRQFHASASAALSELGLALEPTATEEDSANHA